VTAESRWPIAGGINSGRSVTLFGPKWSFQTDAGQSPAS
jgi:hypothetical protein